MRGEQTPIVSAVVCVCIWIFELASDARFDVMLTRRAGRDDRENVTSSDSRSDAF